MNENMPGNKSREYFSKTHDGKLMLRSMLETYVPKKLSHGIKQGFSAPDGSWFKGESIEYINTLLLASDTRLYDYLDQRVVRNIIAEHLSGKQNHRLVIWSLINFEVWLKAFFS